MSLLIVCSRLIVVGARACVMLMAAAAGRGRAGQGAAVVAGAAGPGHEGVGAAAAHGRR